MSFRESKEAYLKRVGAECKCRVRPIDSLGHAVLCPITIASEQWLKNGPLTLPMDTRYVMTIGGKSMKRLPWVLAHVPDDVQWARTRQPS